MDVSSHVHRVPARHRAGRPRARVLAPVPAALTVVALLVGLLALVLATAPGASAAGPVAAGKVRPASTSTAAPQAPRATWVWGRPSTSTLVSFAAGQGVRDLFVSVPWRVTEKPTDLAWLRDLRGRASAAGMRVHALGSETSWVDDPASALTWQREALSTGLFDGVHLDVEPWLHADWSGDRDALLRRWLDLLGTLAGDTALPVEADISFWLHEHAVDGQRVDEAVLARVDAVTVMSYRTTATGADSITGLGGTALAAAARAGKPARLAVETNHLGDDAVSRKQTFHGSTRRVLSSVLASVDAAVRSNPSYAGVAVHDAAGWQALRAR